jgi:hypothetical protein
MLRSVNQTMSKHDGHLVGISFRNDINTIIWLMLLIEMTALPGKLDLTPFDIGFEGIVI